MLKMEEPRPNEWDGVLSLPTKYALAGLRVVVTFEGAECTVHGDDVIRASPGHCRSAQSADCDQFGHERDSELLDGRPAFAVAHIANFVEPQAHLAVARGHGRFGDLPWTDKTFQVRTFDDVDTLDGYSVSHPTNLSVRSA